VSGPLNSFHQKCMRKSEIRIEGTPSRVEHGLCVGRQRIFAPNIWRHFHFTRECSVQRNCRDFECVTVAYRNLRTIDLTTLTIGSSPSELRRDLC
jgi:hypothetical protein